MDYDAWKARWSPRVNTENLERVIHAVELLPAGRKSVLEVGARTGLMTELLVERFPSVTAMDLGPPPIQVPGVRLLAGDATRMPFPDGAFDVAVCEEVLEHIPPSKVPEAARELARVARHEVAVGVPNRQDLRAHRLTCHRCGRTSAPFGHLNSFDEARLLALFPGLTLVQASALGPPADRTNLVSALLMQAAGNPWGTYDQHDPCPHCGGAYEPVHTGLLAKVIAKPGYVLHKAQNRVFPGPPYWLHVLLSKPGPA